MYKVRQNIHWKQKGEERDFTVTTSAATGSLGGAGAGRTVSSHHSLMFGFQTWHLQKHFSLYVQTLSGSVCISVAIVPLLYRFCYMSCFLQQWGLSRAIRNIFCLIITLGNLSSEQNNSVFEFSIELKVIRLCLNSSIFKREARKRLHKW